MPRLPGLAGIGWSLHLSASEARALYPLRHEHKLNFCPCSECSYSTSNRVPRKKFGKQNPQQSICKHHIRSLWESILEGQPVLASNPQGLAVDHVSSNRNIPHQNRRHSLPFCWPILLLQSDTIDNPFHIHEAQSRGILHSEPHLPLRLSSDSHDLNFDKLAKSHLLLGNACSNSRPLQHARLAYHGSHISR